MRLLTLTLLVLGALILLILLLPATFLQATGSVLPDETRMTTGGLLAGVAQGTGRPATASEVYDYLIRIHPESSDLYRLKSEALREAGDTTGALKALDAALARDPDNVSLMEKKARLLIRTGKTPEAADVFATILSSPPTGPEDHLIIADVALEKNRYVEALDRYAAILEMQPDNGRVWEKHADVIFALLTIPTAGSGASEDLLSKDLYADGMAGYHRALTLSPDRRDTIQAKINRRSAEYVARSVQELEDRYSRYRYLKPGEEPFSS